jgi:hypothetical protein
MRTGVFKKRGIASLRRYNSNIKRPAARLRAVICKEQFIGIFRFGAKEENPG